MFKFLRRFLKEEEDPHTRLMKKFASFRELLENNNQALVSMADMEEKASEEFVFDMGYLHQQVDHLEACLAKIVAALNRLTQNRYQELFPILEAIREDIRREIAAVPAIPEAPYILPLQALTREKAAIVGSKMANLGEIKNKLGLEVPRGFAITASAYQAFINKSGLAEEIEVRLQQADIDDLKTLQAVSREIQTLVEAAPLPPDLEQILRLAAEALPTDRLAVRSSAVGEDTEFSFAGQFATLLNVPVQDLPVYYKKIVASKFTTRAIFYWKHYNFSVQSLPMAVGVLAMVPAAASGVMFSTDPQDPESDRVLINAVWGLGKYAVDGTITPDHFSAARSEPHQLLEQKIAQKPLALRCDPEGGCAESALPPEEAGAPCLTPDQVKSLAHIAALLEKHFGCPQDIEWAVDERGRIVILQSRPLRLSAPPGRKPETAKAAPGPRRQPLIQHGVRAVGGVAAGVVHILKSDKELEDIPEGAVVVARQPSARLVLVMDRINAVITEVGSPTDHMTILTREFRLPTLVDVGGATEILQPGQLVTVDADNARIYPGLVLELLERRAERPAHWRDNLVFLKLKEILKKIAPLYLIDPESPEFKAENCRTLHDITRFSHEKAMDAMFALDVEEAVTASGVCRLKTDLPLNLFVLDLGGGLAVSGQPEVEEKDVVSRPFKAVLRGFHHPEVSWAGSVAPDLKGFISVFANTMYDMNKADRGLGGKSFAIITDSYLNFNSRLGYHFGLVDTYLSEEVNDNYISFQFKGGAASIDRRERRVRLLSRILDELGFKVRVIGDLVQGRMVKFSLLQSEQTLEMVALLMAFCRQLDLALASEAVMDRCLQAFRRKDYSLTCLRSA
ncbi:MAG: PEP/pyruvate-binding domain-containing protein [Deltaproteobacteria bacterium]|nr:PEP/pyruvate-binding domain-containing protein [Deltaproteobacteria bacterium]